LLDIRKQLSERKGAFGYCYNAKLSRYCNMGKLIISIRTENLSIVKFQLERKHEGGECFERVFIHYGRSACFYPCSAIEGDNGSILLHKAGIGELGDVKISSRDWLKVLRTLGSKEILNRWSDLINNKKVA
jgi:hypothetical protein